MDLTVPAGGSSLSAEIGVGITDTNRDLGSMKRMLVFCLMLAWITERDVLMVQVIMKLEMQTFDIF